MSSDWLEIQLGNFLELKRGYDLPIKKREEGGVEVISSSGVSGFHCEAKVKGPGVITGRYGTIGKVFYSKRDFWPLNTTLYVKDFKGNHPEFVYYFLKTLDFLQYSDKAAVPGVNRNHLHTAWVKVPSNVAVQERIAKFLSALDRKITLNTQINQTLEQMAQALFKSWFVDFDPVIDNALDAGNPIPEPLAERAARRKSMWAAESEKAPARLPAETRRLFPDRFEEDEVLGWVPAGWTIKPLDQVARYQNGLALQKFRPNEGEEFLPVLKIAQLRARKTDGVEKASVNIKPECIVHNGDVVFSWSGTLMIDIWSGGKAALNQHLFKVTSDQYPKWFYFLWTQRHLELFQRIAADKAVTMGHIKRQHLAEAFCLVPEEQLISKAGESIRPLIEKMLSSRLESEELTQLRDTLLPKLLSGELKLPEAEAAVDTALETEPA